MKDLYDPVSRRWYRGDADRVQHYFDHTRSQWVTVDVTRFPGAKCSCSQCAEPAA